MNLLTKALHEVQAHALKEGTRLGYTGKQMESHIAAKVGQFTNSWIKYATADREYGAEAPAKVIREGGKPLTAASPQEREARVENFKSDMQKKMRGE